MSRPLTTLQSVLEGADDAPALLLGSGGGALTRGQLRRLCNQFAASLRASGVQPGDVVTIAEPNTVEYVVAFLGTGLARAVAAPLNQNYRQEEFEFYMDDAKSKLLVVGRDGNAAAEAAGKAPCLTLSVHVSAAGGEPRLEIGSKTQGWEAKLAGAETGGALQDPPQAGDEALFLHTSGTTARPKGVPLSHGNLVASLANIWQTYEFIPADRSLLVMPLFHVHGLMAGLLAPLAAGAAVILPAAGKFSAGTFWKDAVEHGMTFYTAVPTMHQILLARAEQDYPASSPPPLRAIRSCSSALAPATLHKLEAAFKAPVLEAYAMTEASHQMTSNPLPKHGEHRPGTVGKAQGSVQVAILDEQCNVLPPGQIGEVCIRGPNVTQGYKDNPKANEEAFAGDWFHTGDQGHLDGEGYLTLTGRIKELINRGGEKISPIEVDGALLAHPGVAEAVSFAAPDEKYGEVVAAAVVLNEEGKKMQAIEEDIQRVVGQRLSAFKVPKFVFVTDELPKGPTGKISRRFMVDAFIKKEGSGATSAGSQAAAPAIDFSKQPNDGYFLVARALAKLGVRHMFGVIGIPVTQLASAAQACGIRFISCRNEQAAGYAAAAAGFLTGVPGVLLTVSGPGVVHGIAGLSNAQVNCWPLVMISGSCEQNEVGKGAFQECDQLAAVGGHVKWAGQAATAADIPGTIAQAFQAAASGRPGAAYVDIPSNILMASVDDLAAVQQAEAAVAGPLSVPRPAPPAAGVAAAAQLLRGAQRPLLVVGKGAGYAQAEGPLRQLAEAAGLPFLATAMGRGVVPDDSPLCANAARSMALGQADVALVVGARLNWQLHFGEAPRWSSGIKFILLDVEPSEQDAAKSAVVLRGDAGTGATALLAALRQGQAADTPLLPGAAASGWRAGLQAKVAGARDKLAAKMARTAFPLDYHTTLRVVRDELNRLPKPAVVVSEGANTMDNARVLLEPVVAPRSRLDAGTWGTMGVGPGYAIAAAVVAPDRNVVAVEGDSAFGFSGMECETICRYNLPVCVVVMNNGGIYGGDRREQRLRELAAAGLAAAGVPTDPAPTDFVPQSKYHLLMEAFGGKGVAVATADELQAALRQALESRCPTLINVAIDPQAGVESGNVHAFNAPKGGS
ncbi:2-hydroxyacyl- lyase isoform A [Chlorella sorokiniana]|uniref:2-hydroxyacyl-CoA lyase n=1 Tax=Chlorella sorokiniana TaxID=3076 RepID=A0A2P6TMY4_CHLSO|nr:2-hydroxyacyl- lyase isoform A [Chlorella sorokiniana]|eukprot:PRW45703.1 2-hydroxyacyl- lyase isoform A [Chlorella sorokiniana]